MKCKECKGYETCKQYNDIPKSEHCNGPVKQTNEEWFCKLPTYKKAILMAYCYDAFNLDQYACNKHVVIEEWLKQPHVEKEGTEG